MKKYLIGLVIAFLICLLGNTLIHLHPEVTKDIAFITGVVVANIIRCFEDAE